MNYILILPGHSILIHQSLLESLSVAVLERMLGEIREYYE
jgi:hypothetical protein